MRFPADENFPGNAVKSLQAAGHNVKWLRTVSPGMADDAVLALAAVEGRILLTYPAATARFGKICGRIFGWHGMVRGA